MHKNPFSPSFSAVPGTFFGRESTLDGMRDATENVASPYRLLFVTGTRGSGKSSLLHELAEIGREARWLVIETDALNVEGDIYRAIGADRRTAKSATLGPALSIDAIGSVSLGSASASSQENASPSLASAVLEKARKLKTRRGIFIAVDEVQGVKSSVMQQLCSVMQASRAQGLPIIVAACGLPGSYEKICGWKSCSFVMRMRSERLGTLDPQSTLRFMKSMFAKVPEIAISPEEMRDLADYSQGHPYLMHLVGYHLYRVLDELYQPADGTPVHVSEVDTQEAKDRAFADYRNQVLSNILSHIRKNTRAYVQEAAERALRGAEAFDSDILAHLGLKGQQAQRVRERALRTQVLDIDDDGSVYFTVPYFAELFNPRAKARANKLPRTRQVL